MIVALENAYRSEFLFLPTRNGEGKLIGLEIITNFTGVENALRTPTSLVMPRLTTAEMLTLFREQLALLETCQHFFIQQQLLAWININETIADALLSDKSLMAIAERISFLEFSVNENFTDLDHLTENHQLVRLINHKNLTLANFGAGDASTKAVFAGLFTRVMLDKNFIQMQSRSRAFSPFMRAIIAQIKPYCVSILAAGVDDEALRDRLRGYDLAGMQGALWPAVAVSALTTLVQGQ